MHPFPPTMWQVQDWSLHTTDAVLLSCLLILAVWSYFESGSQFSCFAKGCAVVWSGLYLLSCLFAANDPRLPVTLPQLVLSTVLFAATVAVLVRAVRKKAGTPDSKSLKMAIAGVVLGPIVPGCLTATSCGTGSRMMCKNNLKQIGVAVHNYYDDWSVLPSTTSGQPEVSWRIALLPYLDQADTYQMYHRDQSWNAERNQPLQHLHIREYSCPDRLQPYDAAGRFLTAYACPVGERTLLSPDATATFADVTDGASHTVMVVEACGTSIVWTEPRDAPLDAHDLSVNGPGPQMGQSGSILSSFHATGAYALLGDGSVKYVAQDTAPEVINALLTKDDGESIEPEW